MRSTNYTSVIAKLFLNNILGGQNTFLWDFLGIREKLDLRSTKIFVIFLMLLNPVLPEVKRIVPVWPDVPFWQFSERFGDLFLRKSPKNGGFGVWKIYLFTVATNLAIFAKMLATFSSEHLVTLVKMLHLLYCYCLCHFNNSYFNKTSLLLQVILLV